MCAIEKPPKQKPPPIRLLGENTADALRDWVKADITELASTAYDLGKFCFTVSSGSIGLLASLQKLDSAFTATSWTLLPYAVFAVTLLLSLNLVMPRNKNVVGDTDLHELHAQEVSFITSRLWIWFVVWLCGLILSLSTLLKQG